MIDVYDICFIDQSYCNKKHWKKLIEILKYLLINGMQKIIQEDLIFNIKIENEKQNLRLLKIKAAIFMLKVIFQIFCNFNKWLF